MKLIIRQDSILKTLALLSGLGSQLFVPTPFGRVALFDLGCYVFFILSVGHWSTLTKLQRRIVYLSLLWVFSAILSNIINEEPTVVNLKNSMIVFNVTCMLVCSFLILNRSPEAFIWFIVGNGISEVLSFYILPNGALLSFAEAAGYSGGNLANYLIEKQVYPVYADAVVKSVLFPLAISSSLGVVIVNLLILITGFILLMAGSRSSFGIFAASSLLGLAYIFRKKAVERMLNKIVLTILLFVTGAFVLIQVYSNLAETGKLGIYEKEKFESQFIESGLGFFGGREEFLYTSGFILKSPFFGAGAQRIDKLRIIDNVTEKYGIKTDTRSYGKSIPGHSVLMGSWVENGIGAGIFWIYVLLLVIQFLRKIPSNYPNFFSFYFYLYLVFIWGILFSPFGGERGLYCFLIAFAVIKLEDLNMDQFLTNENY